MTTRTSSGQNSTAIDQNQPGNSTTGQVSQGEGTQTGIFAGAEKLMASDIDAPKKAKEDLANQGAGLVTTNGNLEFVDAETATSPESNQSVSREQVAHNSHVKKENKKAFSTADLPPLPDLSENVDDADFLAWLHENNQLSLNENSSQFVDPAVRKKYLRYLQELHEVQERQRSRSNSLQPEVRSRSDSSITTLSSGSSSGDLEGKSRGPLKSIVHALHLDRADRKKKKIIRKKQVARLDEEIDMANWEAKLKRHHEKKMSRKTQEKEEFEEDEQPSTENVENTDATDSSQSRHGPIAVPLTLLNPEFIEKKQEEDEILKSGGDLGKIAVKKEDEVEELIPISSERITELIKQDHTKKELSEDAPTPFDKEDNLKGDQVQVKLRTADSLDQLNRFSTTDTPNRE